MEVEYDESKRQDTLDNRGLDFDDAPKIFAGTHYTHVDDRRNYGEVRNITVGMVGDDVIVIVWTERAPKRRIISMRKASLDERGDYYDRMD